MLLRHMASPPSDINLGLTLAADISRTNVSRGMTYRVPRTCVDVTSGLSTISSRFPSTS